jgi:hypothetical protein
MGTRTGFLIPILSNVLPVLIKGTPLELLKRLGSDEKGRFTDAYVLLSALILAVWLSLLRNSPLFPFLATPLVRWGATAILGWYVLGLAIFLLKWLFVDQDAPVEKRAVLLFLFNLVQLRLVLCIVAVLVGGLPSERRWILFRGAMDSSQIFWGILLPYQLLTWLVIGIAIGALAGSLRTRQGSAT